jgi:hypothetical protein
MTGRVMNRDYKLTAKAHQFTIDERGGDNLSDFPIEKARLRSACYLVPMVALCILAYGWAVQQKMVRCHNSIPSDSNSLIEPIYPINISFLLRSPHSRNVQCKYAPHPNHPEILLTRNSHSQPS